MLKFHTFKIVPVLKRKFVLFADYHQFYFQDEQYSGNLLEAWTEQAVSDMLVVAPGVIRVGTDRNMDVPVEVEVLDSQPDDNFDDWDQVTEFSIEVPSGRIVIAGCTDYFPDAARLTVQLGTYKGRVYYGALDSIDKFHLEGNDNYRVVLWLDADTAKPKVLKRYENA